MKKLIALLIVCGFAMSFIACGSGSQSEADSADSVETESPAMDPAPVPAPIEADSTQADTTAL